MQTRPASIREKLNSSGNRAGMTLLEIILAIAVAGFLLYASTAYVVSISNIWADREERHFFEDHVDGVTEFLKSTFLSAGRELSLSNNENTNQAANGPDANSPENNPNPVKLEAKNGNQEDNREDANTQNNADSGSSLMTKTETPISWEKPPGASGYEDPMLHFTLAEVPPLLVGLDGVPATKVDLFLHFDEQEGLGLLWHSNLQEKVEDTEDLQRTKVSSHVSELRYIYWDETFEKWEEEEKPRDGEGEGDFLLPSFLKIIFTYKEEEKARLLPLPVPMESALLF